LGRFFEKKFYTEFHNPKNGSVADSGLRAGQAKGRDVRGLHLSYLHFLYRCEA
jgi:hypothetical protein